VFASASVAVTVLTAVAFSVIETAAVSPPPLLVMAGAAFALAASPVLNICALMLNPSVSPSVPL
jgi:hypothetical protein